MRPSIVALYKALACAVVPTVKVARARDSLRWRVPVGVSVDGLEGPGSYGLNRNVTLTVLVGKAGRVRANFALVQPSDADGPAAFWVLKLLLAGSRKPCPDVGKVRALAHRGANSVSTALADVDWLSWSWKKTSDEAESPVTWTSRRPSGLPMAFATRSKRFALPGKTRYSTLV